MDAPTRLAIAIAAICLYAILYVSDAYGNELPLAVKIVACESRGLHWDMRRPFKLNCNRHEPMGGKSCGIAQFQYPTFLFMRSKARRPELKYRDPLDQLWLLNWAVDHGYAGQWSCYWMISRGKWRITAAHIKLLRDNPYITEVYGGVE